MELSVPPKKEEVQIPSLQETEAGEPEKEKTPYEKALNILIARPAEETSGSIICFDTYNGLTYEMENHDIRYKSNSSSIMRLAQYCSKIKTSISHLEQPTKELWVYLAKHINKPQLSSAEITELQERTSLERSQIRDFFKNQRKRYIIPISNALDEDFKKLAEILADDEESLNGYLNKISGNTC